MLVGPDYRRSGNLARRPLLGAIADPRIETGASHAHAALGFDLYGGTSGIALFLAHLNSLTGEQGPLRTARGAIRQALALSASTPRTATPSLYLGHVGVAYAASRVGTLVGDGTLVDAAVRMLYELSPAQVDDDEATEIDLLSGTAGAIIGLLAVHHETGDSRLLDIALRYGERLLDGADEAHGGLCWRSPGFPQRPALTGFSHGVAGIGYALLELFAKSGQVRFRDAAVGAYRYERYWFDAHLGNWADLREHEQSVDRAHAPLSFAVTWCHGAPGIALSRLRALAVLGPDPVFAREAETALRTTARAVESWLSSGEVDFSPCHGLAGNADVLLHGSEAKGGLRSHRDLARRASRREGTKISLARGDRGPAAPGQPRPQASCWVSPESGASTSACTTLR